MYYEMYDTDLCQIIAFALVKALEALLNICDLEPKWWGFELISLTVHHQPHNKYRKCEFLCIEHFGCDRNPNGCWHQDFQRLQYECTGCCDTYPYYPYSVVLLIL